MTDTERRAHSRKTIRFTFTEERDGRKSYDHEFGDDGKVEFREVPARATSQPSKSGEQAAR